MTVLALLCWFLIVHVKVNKKQKAHQKKLSDFIYFTYYFILIKNFRSSKKNELTRSKNIKFSRPKNPNLSVEIRLRFL